MLRSASRFATLTNCLPPCAGAPPTCSLLIFTLFWKVGNNLAQDNLMNIAGACGQCPCSYAPPLGPRAFVELSPLGPCAPFDLSLLGWCAAFDASHAWQEQAAAGSGLAAGRLTAELPQPSRCFKC